jgi:hypothetical protein
LYLSKGQMSKYIHVQEGENIQRTSWRNAIIKNANTYLINRTYCWSSLHLHLILDPEPKNGGHYSPFVHQSPVHISRQTGVMSIHGPATSQDGRQASPRWLATPSPFSLHSTGKLISPSPSRCRFLGE